MNAYPGDCEFFFLFNFYSLLRNSQKREKKKNKLKNEPSLNRNIPFNIEHSWNQANFIINYYDYRPF